MGVDVGAETEVGVDRAEGEEFIPGRLLQTGGEGRERGRDRRVVDRTGGLGDEEWIRIGEEAGDLGAFEATVGEQHAEAHGTIAVGRGGGESGGVVAAHETHHGGVPEIEILVAIGAEELEQRTGGLRGAELAEALRGEEADARCVVLERGDQRGERGGLAGITQNFGGLRANLGIAVAEQGGQGREGAAILAGDLPEPPDGVKPGELRGRCVGGDGGERRGRGAAGEFELGLGAHALVGVGEELGQLSLGAGLEALAEQALGFLHERVGGVGRMRDRVDAAAAGLGPAVVPVGEVELAVGAERQVGGQGGLDEGLARADLERGTLWGDGVGLHAAARGRALEVRDEEVALVGATEAGARVVVDAGRAVFDVGDRGEEVRGLTVEAGIPKLFQVPRAGAAERGELVADAPAAVAALNHVDETFHVTLVGVVVTGPEIAVLVEREFLRIAQAGRDDLEVGAIRIAAEHRALVGQGDRVAFLGDDVRAAVADREVELAVGAEDQAVQIVTGVVEVDAVAAAHLAAADRLSVGRGALEDPHARDVGEPDLTVAGEHARGDAVERAVETLGVDAGEVGLAVAIAVLDEADALALDRELLRAFAAEDLFDHRDALIHRAQGEIGLEHRRDEVADIEYARAVAVGFCDKEAALLVKGEGDRIGQHRLRSPDADGKRLRDLHARDRLFGFVGGLVYLGLGHAGRDLEEFGERRIAGGGLGRGGNER